MSIVDISRELLVQEIREVAPMLILVASHFILSVAAYCVARICMAKKYCKKNMPEQAQRHVDYLAVKLRETEIERDAERIQRQALERRLRGLFALMNLPLSVDLIKNKTEQLFEGTRTIENLKKFKVVK